MTGMSLLDPNKMAALVVGKALAEAIEEKEAEDLEKAIKASLADSDSSPDGTSISGVPVAAESSKCASKRRREDSGEEDRDDTTMGSGKRVRNGVRLDVGDFMKMINVDNKDDDDVDDDLKSCVVKHADITTTFKDVYVSPDAIEALEIHMLSIHDPAAFTFGILSNSAPPGILLYGPPGTGKTLLVRALAKQAKATILALSGADIRSKFVGEGEKKIKRIFAYARKHHPCVIFIDEADSVFRSRSAESNCRGHLSDINQFLGEMDGMNSNDIRSPMVIAATNRPFDIDEGILRRLGRRILVDLPNPEAREQIMKIHLKGETLADDVEWPELVKATQGYTGSDLKDMIWAAAIAAVRGNLHRTRKGSKLPEGTSKAPASSEGSRRVLYRAHFLQASQEIRPAPNSETVNGIREFHNKFGNTAQRAAGSSGRDEVINKTKDPVYV